MNIRRCLSSRKFLQIVVLRRQNDGGRRRLLIAIAEEGRLVRLHRPVKVIEFRILAEGSGIGAGGIGIGQLQLASEDGQVRLESDTGPAGMFAIGFEVLQTRRNALDLQFRVASTNFEDADLTITNASFNIAYNWY